MDKLKICFVCNGNNSRSVMAEFIARNKWKDAVEVTSCGINASEGNEISYHTKKVLSELGISIEKKRRNRISQDYIQEHMFYFAMDDVVRNVLINEYKIPAVRIKILNPNIRDPKDCNLDIYRECRDMIQNSIWKINIQELEKRIQTCPFTAYTPEQSHP